jgi:hypothetical protein
VLPSAADALSINTGFQVIRLLGFDVIQRAAFTPYLWIGAYLLAAEVLLILTLAVRPRRPRIAAAASSGAS